jgi:hypothetical protein
VYIIKYYETVATHGFKLKPLIPGQVEDRVRQRRHDQHGLAQAAAAKAVSRQGRQGLLRKPKLLEDDSEAAGSL